MSVDDSRYGRGWTPTESKGYKAEDRDNGVFIRPGAPIEVPTKYGPFTVVMNDFGNREIHPPEGYALPDKLDGDWTTLADAIRAVRWWEDKNEGLVAVQEQIALPLTGDERAILTRKGGAG